MGLVEATTLQIDELRNWLSSLEPTFVFLWRSLSWSSWRVSRVTLGTDAGRAGRRARLRAPRANGATRPDPSELQLPRAGFPFRPCVPIRGL